MPFTLHFGSDLWGAKHNVILPFLRQPTMAEVVESAQWLFDIKCRGCRPAGYPDVPFTAESVQLLRDGVEWVPVGTDLPVTEKQQFWCFQPESIWHSDAPGVLPPPIPMPFFWTTPVDAHRTHPTVRHHETSAPPTFTEKVMTVFYDLDRARSGVISVDTIFERLRLSGVTLAIPPSIRDFLKKADPSIDQSVTFPQWSAVAETYPVMVDAIFFRMQDEKHSALSAHDASRAPPQAPPPPPLPQPPHPPTQATYAALPQQQQYLPQYPPAPPGGGQEQQLQHYPPYYPPQQVVVEKPVIVERVVERHVPVDRPVMHVVEKAVPVPVPVPERVTTAPPPPPPERYTSLPISPPPPDGEESLPSTPGVHVGPPQQQQQQPVAVQHSVVVMPPPSQPDPEPHIEALHSVPAVTPPESVVGQRGGGGGGNPDAAPQLVPMVPRASVSAVSSGVLGRGSRRSGRSGRHDDLQQPGSEAASGGGSEGVRSADGGDSAEGSGLIQPASALTPVRIVESPVSIVLPEDPGPSDEGVSDGGASEPRHPASSKLSQDKAELMRQLQEAREEALRAAAAAGADAKHMPSAATAQGGEVVNMFPHQIHYIPVGLPQGVHSPVLEDYLLKKAEMHKANVEKLTRMLDDVPRRGPPGPPASAAQRQQQHPQQPYRSAQQVPAPTPVTQHPPISVPSLPGGGDLSEPLSPGSVPIPSLHSQHPQQQQRRGFAPVKPDSFDSHGVRRLSPLRPGDTA